MWKFIISIVLVGFLGGGIFFLTAFQKRSTTESSTSSSTRSQEIEKSDVPLPQAEDIVRLFFNLISEKRIPEAIAMMSKEAVPDDSAKQAWGVQFNSFKKIEIVGIEQFEKEKMYKVTLQVEVKPESANAPIPYHGWENGQNVRFVGVEKNTKGVWNIRSIATGP